MRQIKKRIYNTEAQKKSYEKYKKKNDLINLCVRVPREKKYQYQKDSAWLGKAFVRHITDLLEEAHKILATGKDEAVAATAAANIIENDGLLREEFYRRVTEIVEVELKQERIRIAYNILSEKKDSISAEELQRYTGLPLQETKMLLKQFNS